MIIIMDDAKYYSGKAPEKGTVRENAFCFKDALRANDFLAHEAARCNLQFAPEYELYRTYLKMLGVCEAEVLNKRQDACLPMLLSGDYSGIEDMVVSEATSSDGGFVKRWNAVATPYTAYYIDDKLLQN